MTRGRTSLLPATSVLALALALTGCRGGGEADAWHWTPRFGTEDSVSGKVMAVSEDREHVYSLWTAYGESRLVELDYGTGRQQRVWQVPPTAAERLTSASGVMAGNQLVLFNVFGSKYDRAHAVMVEIGEPAAG